MSARDARTPGYFCLDHEIVEVYGAKIGVYGLAVYAALVHHANSDGKCWPSIPYLAGLLNCSPRKLNDTLTLLKAVGLIAINERHAENKRQLSNEYVILAVAKLPKYCGPTRHGVPGECAQSAGGRVHHVPTNKNHKEQEQEGSFAYAQEPGAVTDTADHGLTIPASDAPPTTPADSLPAPRATTKDAAKAKALPSRPADPLWDAFVQVWSLPAHGGRHKGLAGEFSRDAAAAGATPEEAREYAQAMADAGKLGDTLPIHKFTRAFLAWRSGRRARAATAAPLDAMERNALDALAKEAGINLRFVSERDRLALEDIARGMVETRMSADALATGIRAARRHPNIDPNLAPPVWAIQAGLAKVLPLAVPR